MKHTYEKNSENTKKFLIVHIKGTFSHRSDIGRALDELEEFKIDVLVPTLKRCSKTNKECIKQENEELKVWYRARLDSFIK